MKDIEIILSLIGTCFGLFITLLTYFIRLSKNKKSKQKALELLEISEKIVDYIRLAEGKINYTGEEKKEYVMTKLNQYAIKNEIDFSEEEVSSKIDNLVDFTKEVNSKKTTSWL